LDAGVPVHAHELVEEGLDAGMERVSRQPIFSLLYSTNPEVTRICTEPLVNGSDYLGVPRLDPTSRKTRSHGGHHCLDLWGQPVIKVINAGSNLV
jgi:hypothetical protein